MNKLQTLTLNTVKPYSITVQYATNPGDWAVGSIITSSSGGTAKILRHNRYTASIRGGNTRSELIVTDVYGVIKETDTISGSVLSDIAITSIAPGFKIQNGLGGKLSFKDTLGADTFDTGNPRWEIQAVGTGVLPNLNIKRYDSNKPAISFIPESNSGPSNIKIEELKIEKVLDLGSGKVENVRFKQPFETDKITVRDGSTVTFKDSSFLGTTKILEADVPDSGIHYNPNDNSNKVATTGFVSAVAPNNLTTGATWPIDVYSTGKALDSGWTEISFYVDSGYGYTKGNKFVMLYIGLYTNLPDYPRDIGRIVFSDDQKHIRCNYSIAAMGSSDKRAHSTIVILPISDDGKLYFKFIKSTGMWGFTFRPVGFM